MRIAVFGAGGVGGVIGAHLARGGHEIVLLARGEHLQAIRQNGLSVEKPGDDFTITPIQATDDPADVDVVDAVLMCVKTWQLREAAAAVRPMCGPDTMVVTFQNGVEATDIVGDVLGAEYAVPGICSTLSFLKKPGLICQSSRQTHLEFCESDGRVSDRIKKLGRAMKESNLLVTIPANIHAAQWKKLLLLGPFSGVGCLTRAPIGIWRKIPQTRSLVGQCVNEILNVARAKGIDLDESSAKRTIATLDRLPPESTSSMQRDFDAGRRSELDSQIGVVVRLGSEYGIETPVHSFIYAALLPLEMKAQGSIDWAIAADA